MIVTRANKKDKNSEQQKQNYDTVASFTDFLAKKVRKSDDGLPRSKRSSENIKESTKKRDVVG